MGGEDFYAQGDGETAREAFDNTVQQAQYDHGHAGYTGTIAEKGEFVVFEVPKTADAATIMNAVGVASSLNVGVESVEQEAARELYAAFPLDRIAAVFDDKWGPAGAIQLPSGRWYFFGSASS
jgi:hypothetical protein